MKILQSTNCPQCKVLEQKLNEAHIQYIINNDIEEMQRKGFLMAPKFEVDGQVMNFTEALGWIKAYAN